MWASESAVSVLKLSSIKVLPNLYQCVIPNL